MNINDKITVLVSSSPIPSHPSLHIIQETIASVRYQLPNAPIIVMLDGVRKEQQDSYTNYYEYVRLLLDKVHHSKDRKIRLRPFFEFTHQALMTIKTLTEVTTPFILFVEHDTPLMERAIEWGYLKSQIEDGTTNHIRLHYDEEIHPDHRHMMCGNLTRNLIKCVQFHNRPYLTNTEWFRGLLAANFTDASRTFIEDVLYSPISCAPWSDYKLTIYDPEGDGKQMKRSRDLNGRATDPKYPMIF
jgi:hypothetical protein